MISDPDAKQVVVATHEMPVTEVIPVGTVSGLQVVPPLSVEMMAGPGARAEEPTAVQSRLSGHAIPLKLVIVAGIDSEDHVVPPSVVPMMPGPPTPLVLAALHVKTVLHETAVRFVVSIGAVSRDQFNPPFVVRMISGLSLLCPKIPNPTATQKLVVAHEIPFKPSTAVGIACWFQVNPSF
jgi:hypothetical protein